MQNAKLAYTVEEASKSTGIGKNTLRNLIEWKKIPVIKVGRKFLINIILGLMASCTFISTSSHSVLSMLAAPSTPAALAAPRNNAAAPSLVPPMARVSLTMDSYTSAGLPSRTPSACRSFTPCRRASATASLHVPYRFTSSALAGPSLFTV